MSVHGPSEDHPMPTQLSGVDGVYGAANFEVPTEHDQFLIGSPSEVHRQQNRNRILIGAGMLLASAGVVFAIGSGEGRDAKVEYNVPYTPAAQEAINSVDSILIGVGEVAFPLALAGIGGVKLGSRRYPAFRKMDNDSSQELVDDGRRKRGLVNKVTASVLAGSFPVVATGAVTLATFTEAIGNEVADGPQRPISRVFDDLVPGGKTLVVGYESALPMTESDLSRPLVASIQTRAAAEGVKTTILDQNLGIISKDGEDKADLVLGLQQPQGSPLHWNGSKEVPMPVAVDTASGYHDGDIVTLNGTPAVVVDTFEGASAINRVAVVADREAMAALLSKDAAAPDNAVIVNADEETAKRILTEANSGLHETSAVITKERYLENSSKFWESNVKPVTNVLALVSGATALVSVAGIMSSRLLRNRRELAAKMAAGVSDTYIRSTELLRAAKDGVASSISGVSLAAGGTSMANALESGFHIGVGYREVMVGFAVGIVGTVGGAFSRLIRLRKTIDPAESTRA